MITDIRKAKQVLFSHPSNRLAFIVGNGINRYAYGATRDVSWERLLLDSWRQHLRQTVSNIDNGVTYTEFYDIMTLEAEPNILCNSVVEQVKQWPVEQYHRDLQAALRNLDKPILTTNFDVNLEEGLTKVILRPNGPKKDFTDYYPWNEVYTDKQDFTLQDIYGFGVWHINGMITHPRSLQLGLSQYQRLSRYASDFLHNTPLYGDDFAGKNQERWRGQHTWLHLIFNCDLCVFGLALDTQETFLRWLLIERAKYFNKFPNRLKHGWYVGTDSDVADDGKRFFLEKAGFEIIKLTSYDQIYKELLNV